MSISGICYSICERKKYRYVIAVDGDIITLGLEENRLFFEDETEAENYRQLAEKTMNGRFQIIVEKTPTSLRMNKIVASDRKKQYGVPHKSSNTVLKELLSTVDFEATDASHKIFQIYNNSNDKSAIKAIFETIFNVSFDEYLTMCEYTSEMTPNS